MKTAITASRRIKACKSGGKFAKQETTTSWLRPLHRLYDYLSSLWFHHRLIVVTQIRDHALVAAWMLIHADTLPMSQ